VKELRHYDTLRLEIPEATLTRELNLMEPVAVAGVERRVFGEVVRSSGGRYEIAFRGDRRGSVVFLGLRGDVAEGRFWPFQRAKDRSFCDIIMT
jgi:hypothetical protein